jgi:NitT/TauT family transport system substrate-binding protein
VQAIRIHRFFRAFNYLSFALLFIVFAGAVYGAEKAAERPLQKLTVAYSSISGNNAPLWITHERGFFRKNGLDVQLVFIESGSRTVQTLVSGDVTLAQMAGPAVIQSNMRGADTVMIAGVINTLTFQLIVDKNINHPDLLKGKNLAVTRYGSATDFATRYALEKYGLQPDKDVAILQLGSMPAIFAGLESGKIQGAMLSAPTTLKAKKAGFLVLADLQMLGLEYQHTGVAATRALIKSRPELVRSFMKAYVEGIHFYKTQRKESLAILAKYLKTDDVEALNEIYDDIGLVLVPQKPYPTLRGIQTILKELSPREPKAEGSRPEQFVDLTFIKELDSSGYIDGLYRSAPVVAKRDDTKPTPAPALAKEKTAPVDEKTKVASKRTVSQEKPKAETVTAQVSSPASGAVQEYTIKSGDTLSKLALQFYGKMHYWEKIYAANKDTVRNPNFIFVGQIIKIPAGDATGT